MEASYLLFPIKDHRHSTAFTYSTTCQQQEKVKKVSLNLWQFIKFF